MNIKAQTIVKYLKAGPPGPPGENGESAVQLLARPAAVVYQQGVAATYDVEWVLAEGGSEQPAAGYTIPTLDDGSQLKTGAATQGLRFSVPANGTMRLHVLASCAYKGCVSTTYSYNGKTYAGKVSVAPAAKGDPGEPGQPGSVGATVRTLDWDAIPKDGTFQIYSGAEGEPYLDVVFYGAAKYMCKLSYRPAASSPTPQDDATHYEMAAQWGFIAARLLMAEYSAIDLMQTNGLRVFDADGALAGGVAGGTGAGAVVYIAPMRRPVSASVVYTRRTVAPTGLLGTPSGVMEQRAGEAASIQLAKNYALFASMTVLYSDGTAEIADLGEAARNTGTTAMPLSLTADFWAGPEGASPADAGIPSGLLPPVPAVDGSAPALWARLRVRSGSLWEAKDWVLAGSVSRGLNPNEAMAQLRRDGSAMFGSHGGRRIEIDPSESAITFFGPDGAAASVFDADPVESIEEVFGEGESLQLSSASSAVVSATNARKGEAVVLSSSANGAGWLTIDSLDVEVLVPYNTEPPNSSVPRAQDPYCTITLRIGGKEAGTQTVKGAWRQAVTKTVRFAGASGIVRAGQASVSIELSYAAWNDSEAMAPIAATATIAAGASATVAYGRQVNRWFGNGFAVGSSTSNYLRAWVSGGSLCFEAVNPSCGLRVAPEGVKINRGDGQGWVAL